MRASIITVVSLVIAAMAFGCSSEEETPVETVADMGSSPRVDRGTMPPVRERPWTTGTVEGDGTGQQPSLAVSASGTIGVAYFQSTGVTGEACTEVGDEAGAPNKTVWTVRYARLAGDEWRAETVHEPLLVGTPVGVSLRYDGDSTPHVATMTGEPLEMLRYCGANDVGLLTPGDDGWDLETVVSESNEAASGMPGSDFGSVVGYWPGLSFDNEGQPAIAYRDVHGGGLQGDDLTRADMEFAWKRGGSWQNIAVDIGEGAGDFNQVVFDADNRPVILYSNPVEQQSADKLGLWIARGDAMGDEWEKTRLFEGKTSERPSMARHPETGDLWVSFYNVEEGRPYIAQWSAGSDFSDWTLTALGDPRYIEGEHPSIAIDANGYVSVVWYRCVRVGQGSTCDPQDDGIVFAWFVDDEWLTEVIDDGEMGLCGRYPNLAFGRDNRGVVVYQCAVRSGDTFDFELRYARRNELR